MGQVAQQLERLVSLMPARDVSASERVKLAVETLNREVEVSKLRSHRVDEINGYLLGEVNDYFSTLAPKATTISSAFKARLLGWKSDVASSGLVARRRLGRRLQEVQRRNYALRVAIAPVWRLARIFPAEGASPPAGARSSSRLASRSGSGGEGQKDSTTPGTAGPGGPNRQERDLHRWGHRLVSEIEEMNPNSALACGLVLLRHRWSKKMGHSCRRLAHRVGSISGEVIARELEGEGDASWKNEVSLARARSRLELLANPRGPVDRLGVPTPAQYDVAGNRSGVLLSLHNSLPDKSGGYATRSHGLAQELAAWLPVVAATRPGFPYERSEEAQRAGDARWIELVDGIQYSRVFSDGACRYDVPLDAYIDICADWYAQQAAEHEVAGIHSASFAYNGLASVIAGRRLGLPVVYEVRGLQYITTRSMRPEWRGSEAELLDQRLEWAAGLESDHVFTLNGPMRDELMRLGVPHEKITIVPNGVDTSRFYPRRRDARVSGSLGLDGKFVFGYVGSLLDYEGLDDLVDAVAMLRDGGASSEFAVMVVGSGPEEDRLRRKVASLGLEDIMTIVGQVAHTRIEDYLSVCDVTVYPRRRLEVCELVTPTKPFEAMAMGVCPLMSDVAALAEIAGNGARGRLFPAEDSEGLAAAMEGLIASPEDVAAKGHAARQWVESERSWEAVAREVVAKYQELGMVRWNESVSASSWK